MGLHTWTSSTLAAIADMGRHASHAVQNGWRTLHLGAVIVVLLLSPSAYGPASRQRLAEHLVRSVAPLLLWYTVLSALLGLVLIRIVVVTAQSYGLSQYALEMVVRVLVLELIPLGAALFVALRASLPQAMEVRALRLAGELDRLRASGEDPLHQLVLPRVVGSAFAVLLFAVWSGVLAMGLAYFSVYGFSPWGLEAYTRTLGQVFNGPVSLIFALKTLAFSLAVAVVPVASALFGPSRANQADAGSGAELQALVRLFVVLLLIEAASLVGNYY